MITIKLSHSILSTWARGQWEEAVGQYLGKDIPPTPEMELGKTYDEIWNNHIVTTGERPAELGGGKLTKPEVQVKYRKTIPFNKDYQILLSGVPDLVHTTSDGLIIDEHKCGRSEANDYIERFQLDYYKLLLPEAVKGVYRCYNPYFETLTVGVKYLDDHNAENALNHILTYGGEMIEYLAANKMIIDYKEGSDAKVRKVHK